MPSSLLNNIKTEKNPAFISSENGLTGSM